VLHQRCATGSPSRRFVANGYQLQAARRPTPDVLRRIAMQMDEYRTEGRNPAENVADLRAQKNAGTTGETKGTQEKAGA